MPDGRDAIGSRLEGSVLEREFYPTERPVTDNPDVVSGTYVLDLFVANPDRHNGQWLVTEVGGGVLLRPIDFSRAWFRRWPLPTPPFGPGSPIPENERDNSQGFYALAKKSGVLAQSECQAFLETLKTMPKDHWRSIVDSVPTGWLEPQQAIELVNWWWSPQWRTRVSWIEAQI